jgi:hypothetical protein
MKKMTKQQVGTLNSIRQSKGRFFGLYTTSGEVMNAQFLGETDSFIRVYDRNNGVERKLAKTSIKSANVG